jgi:hypothetical protein
MISQGKQWQEARHHINPVLMQTKIVEMYAPKIDQVAEDFVAKYSKFIINIYSLYKILETFRIPSLMDSKSELPEDFKNELHKWALECKKNKLFIPLLKWYNF